jgi:hypothetical protein
VVFRGTDCLATRLWFDKEVDIPYSANPVWGFDKGVGMTFFDIGTIQSPAHDDAPGSVVEVDYYHAGKLLGMSDEAIVAKAHRNLCTMLPDFKSATVVDSGMPSRARLCLCTRHFASLCRWYAARASSTLSQPLLANRHQ